MGRVVNQEKYTDRMAKERTMREMTKVRPLMGVAALVFLALAVGCGGLVSDQGKVRQDVKQKVHTKEQHAKNEVKKKVRPKSNRPGRRLRRR
jgi:hypothetical protein